MSDEQKRDAIISARRLGKTAYGIRLVEEIVRLRAENAALRAAIERLRAENAALKAAVERVRALHRQGFTMGCCRTCKGYDDIHVPLPCPTLRALEVERE